MIFASKFDNGNLIMIAALRRSSFTSLFKILNSLFSNSISYKNNYPSKSYRKN
jgi:hypothetical protein